MVERDFRNEAEKLVDACARLEQTYKEAFDKVLAIADTKGFGPKFGTHKLTPAESATCAEALARCEQIARQLEKLDPDSQLEEGLTLHPAHRELHQVELRKYLKKYNIALR